MYSTVQKIPSIYVCWEFVDGDAMGRMIRDGGAFGIRWRFFDGDAVRTLGESTIRWGSTLGRAPPQRARFGEVRR